MKNQKWATLSLIIALGWLLLPFSTQAQIDEYGRNLAGDILSDIPAYPIQDPPRNIIDLFMDAPDSAFLFENDFGFKGRVDERENLLKTAKIDYRACYERDLYWKIDTIDLRNGYIRFHSLTDGAGCYWEATYYNVSDGSKLLLLCKTDWNMVCEFSEIRILSLRKDSWKEVTQEVLPQVMLTDFLESRQKPASLSVKENENPEITYKLPQRGKRLIVELSDCYKPEYMDIPTEIERELHYQRLYLEWNDGRFWKGEREKNDE